MCQIAILTKITDDTSENAWEFIKQMSKEMGLTQKDGFGYAAVDSKGNLFGERWKNPSQAFSYNALLAAKNASDAVSKFKSMIKPKEEARILYNNFGVVDGAGVKALRGAILHARTATSPNVMENTHPFVSEDKTTALIHNGHINNLSELCLKTSTCDSEAILNEYLKQGVNRDLLKIQDMAGNLQGYYACGVISKDAEGKWIIDIFRDKGAYLDAYFIQELNCVVFATPSAAGSQYATGIYGSVPSACRELGFTITEHYEVKKSSVVRIDVESGEPIINLDFNSEYKKKDNGKRNKGEGRGNRRNRQATYPATNQFDGTAQRWNSFFGSTAAGAQPDKRFWTPEEKEKDMERMLTSLIINESGDSCPIPIVGPPSPTIRIVNKTAEEVIKEFKNDFIADGNGTWHRKGTGTDRE